MIQQALTCLGRFIASVFENPSYLFSNTALGSGRAELPILDSLLLIQSQEKVEK